MAVGVFVDGMDVGNVSVAGASVGAGVTVESPVGDTAVICGTGVLGRSLGAPEGSVQAVRKIRAIAVVRRFFIDVYL
jgi:hypothetical protein